MRIFVVIIFALLSPIGSFSQTSNNTKSLSINDILPDVSLGPIINFNKSTLELSELKDKLVILDFWATWCTPCINNFPKLYEFQKEFKDKIQILLVNAKTTRDSKIAIEKFFEERKTVYQLPSLVNDTILGKLFPHKTIPHYVWIKAGVVRAITAAEEITRENINKMLNDDEFRMSKKEVEYDNRELLFINGNGGQNAKYIFRSILTEYNDGLPGSGGIKYNKDKLVTRIWQTNLSVMQLYTLAYPEYRKFKTNQIILRVSNPAVFARDSLDFSSWRRKYLFNYEVLFPPRTLDSALNIMQNDLAHYFGFTLHTESREVTCLVLKTVENFNYPLEQPLNGRKTKTNIFEKTTGSKYLIDGQLNQLVSHLNRILTTPVLDESDFTGSVSLTLPSDLTNEVSLRESLKKQGFSLDREKRRVKFLIVTEPKSMK